jgi:hypothetical protein
LLCPLQIPNLSAHGDPLAPMTLVLTWFHSCAMQWPSPNTLASGIFGICPGRLKGWNISESVVLFLSCIVFFFGSGIHCRLHQPLDPGRSRLPSSSRIGSWRTSSHSVSNHGPMLVAFIMNLVNAFTAYQLINALQSPLSKHVSLSSTCQVQAVNCN